MPIITQSPLANIVVGEYSFIPLGDGALGYIWFLSPGFYLPPGLQLDPRIGTIFGIPTISGTYHFLIIEMNLRSKATSEGNYLITISNSSSISESRIQAMIELAFQLQKAYPGQKVWFDESMDAQNRRVLAVKADDNGQIRTIASITVS